MTCRFPGCDEPAQLCDIDHTIAYPTGPTQASNLKCLCRKHHLLKTFGGWRDQQWPDGTVVWTSPHGQTYTTHPGSRILFPTCADPPPPSAHATTSTPTPPPPTARWPCPDAKQPEPRTEQYDESGQQRQRIAGKRSRPGRRSPWPSTSVGRSSRSRSPCGSPRCRHRAAAPRTGLRPAPSDPAGHATGRGPGHPHQPFGIAGLELQMGPLGPPRLSATTRASPTVVSRTRTRLGYDFEGDRRGSCTRTVLACWSVISVSTVRAPSRADTVRIREISCPGSGPARRDSELHRPRCSGPDLHRGLEAKPYGLFRVGTGELDLRGRLLRELSTSTVHAAVSRSRTRSSRGSARKPDRNVQHRDGDQNRQVQVRRGLAGGPDAQHEPQLLRGHQRRGRRPASAPTAPPRCPEATGPRPIRRSARWVLRAPRRHSRRRWSRCS